MPFQEGQRGRQGGDLGAIRDIHQPFEHPPSAGARRKAHRPAPPRPTPQLLLAPAAGASGTVGTAIGGLDDGADHHAHGVRQVGAEPGRGGQLDGVGHLVQADPGGEVEHVQVHLAAYRQHVGGHEQQVRRGHTLPTCVRGRLAGRASAGRHDVVPRAVLLAGRASGACATGPMTAGSARGRGHHLPQEPGGQQAHRPGDLGGPDELDRLRGRRGGHLLHEAAQCPTGGAHEPGPVDDADPRGLGDLLGRPVQSGDPGDPGRCLLGGATQHRHRAGAR